MKFTLSSPIMLGQSVLSQEQKVDWDRRHAYYSMLSFLMFFLSKASLSAVDYSMKNVK